jgi:hypothetical protein
MDRFFAAIVANLFNFAIVATLVLRNHSRRPGSLKIA